MAALAATYDLMQPNGPEGADLLALLEGQLAHFRDLFGVRLRLRGPTLRLNRIAAQNLGMSIHELSTNACKYGALSTQGEIDIDWRVDEAASTFAIEWKESGGPVVVSPSRRGFGWRVTDALAGSGLGGVSHTQYEPSGVVWTLTAPLQQILAATQPDAGPPA